MFSLVSSKFLAMRNITLYSVCPCYFQDQNIQLSLKYALLIGLNNIKSINVSVSNWWPLCRYVVANNRVIRYDSYSVWVKNYKCVSANYLACLLSGTSLFAITTMVVEFFVDYARIYFCTGCLIVKWMIPNGSEG